MMNPGKALAQHEDRLRKLETKLDLLLDGNTNVRANRVAAGATQEHAHSGSGNGGATLGPKILRIGAPTELTIAGGVITVTQTHHLVDTQADAASDDLDTISGLVANQLYVLRPADGSRTVVVKHATGNIRCVNNADITLDDAHDLVFVLSDGTTAWALGDTQGAGGAHDHTTGDGSGVLSNDEHDGYSEYAEIVAPATPAAAKVRVYAKADGLFYVKDDGGVEREMGAVAHAAAADPHPGYVLESLFSAKGELIGSSANDTPSLVAAAAADGYKLESRASATPGLAFIKDYVPIVVVFDGGGSVLSTGVQKPNPYLLENLSIEGWTILGDQSGSIVIDVWQDTYANYPPTVADTIAGTEKPTISAATKNQDLSLSSFDTTLDAGSSLRFNIDSVTSLTAVTLTLHCYRR